MRYIKARNIEKVLDLDAAPKQTALRIRTFLDAMWDAAVNEKHGTNWPNAMQPDVGTVGVVILTTDDVRDFAMSQAGMAKQVVDLAIHNPAHTVSTLVEVLEGSATDLTAVDYIMTKLEGFSSYEQFIIYADRVHLS